MVAVWLFDQVAPPERFLSLDGFELAVIGACVGVGAFLLALGQLLRTERALNATRKAIEATQEGLAINQLLTLIPQLHRLETELEDAAEDNDKKAGRRLLASWRSMAGDILGVLVGHPADWTRVETKRKRRLPWATKHTEDLGSAPGHLENRAQLEAGLRQSIAQVTLAKASLLNGPSSTSCKKATESARTAVAAVCESANVFAATLRTYPVRDDNG
jgi:hypothetical protein